MRIAYPLLALLLITACDNTTGGAMPIDAKDLLEKMDGPKVEGLTATQIEAAKTAEKKGNYEQAIQIYGQILDREAENTDVAIMLAETLRRNKEFDRTIAGYDLILKKHPENLDAKEGKAITLISKGDFETPLDLVNEVLKQDAKRWKTLNAGGILFVTSEKYDDATKYFSEALRYSPDNISVLNNLGLTQCLKKQYAESIKTLNRASTISGADSNERQRIDLNLALVYAVSGDFEAAQKIASQYLSGAKLSNNLGLYAHLAKNDSLAKTYLNMALTDSPTYYEKAWNNLDSLNNTSPASKRETGKLTMPAPEAKTETKVVPFEETTQSLGTIRK